MFPICEWAQRKDNVFISVLVPDCTGEKITIDGDKFAFAGTSHGKNYAVEIELFAAIDKEKSKWTKTGRAIEMILVKVEEGWWDRLTKSSSKLSFVKVDWKRYKDEDEADDNLGESFFLDFA